MKKFVLLTALFALFSQNIDAKSVSVDQAMAIAKQQLAPSTKLNASNAKMTLSYTAMSLKGQNDYYVFNREGGQGYVIVSGDDMTDPVLAYSNHGSFDLNQAPEALKIMLERYQQESSTYQGSLIDDESQWCSSHVLERVW